MGSTTWHPRTTFEKPRQWLLANGELVNEPPLEQTFSGRKVRIAGTDLSAFSRDMDELILKAVDEFAKQKQTCVWMAQHDAQAALEGQLDFSPDQTPAELYVLKKDLKEKTIVWWRFRHPTLPIEAVLFVRAVRSYVYSATSDHCIATVLAAPDTVPSSEMTASYLCDENGNFSVQVNQLDGQQYATTREFIRDNPPSTWSPASILGRRAFGTERLMVEALLEKVRACDELESIEIPDLRDPDNPGWLELELYDTNVNANFLSDLTEYLEGAPTVEEALRIYGELQQCLRGIGLALDDKTVNDFQQGLLGDEPAGVTVEIGATDEEGGQKDHEHTLRMHLPTGTFVVDCGLRVNRNAVADRWEEARTVASLTGEEDTLLAFAREVTRRDQDKRARKIIKERKGDHK